MHSQINPNVNTVASVTGAVGSVTGAVPSVNKLDSITEDVSLAGPKLI